MEPLAVAVAMSAQNTAMYPFGAETFGM